MDSRRCSAALGFTLLIGCVIGIVILIYNGGSTRRSSETGNTLSSSSMPHNHKSHHHRAGSTTVVGGRNGGDHFVPAVNKDGFANDPNYRSSQPTMQEVNELADELRLLSSKSKHVLSSGKGHPVNSGVVSPVKKTNGSVSPASSSSATSSAKATISAVNYSSIPKKGSFVPAPGSLGLLPPPASGLPVPPTSALPHKNRPLASSSVTRQEVGESHLQQQQQHHNRKAHPGHQSPPSLAPAPKQKAAQLTVDSGERHKAFELPEDKMGRGGGGTEGLAHNDLYTTSWHPSMVSPAGGGMATANHPYHHPLSHRRAHGNNNPQQPNRASYSPAKVNKTGKGTGYPLNPNQSRAPNPKQSQHGYQHPDHEKEERTHEEHGDFVEADEDDDEDDVSANPANVKKEEEFEDDNDILDDENEEDEEEDEEEEAEEDDDDEDDNGANPESLMEPKNLAADLETLVSLANHLYTSPASLLSAFSQAKNNSTKKSGLGIPPEYPAALQGFLKVVNETLQRSNNSKLLVELNELYRGREARMSHTNLATSSSSSASSGTGTTSALEKSQDKPETAYEKSLTAFVFMSFGVFLLNQIHSFVQKAADEHLKHHKFLSNDTVVGQGRSLPWEDIEDGPFSWYSPHSEMLMTSESSSLDILFQPPVSANVSATPAGNGSSAADSVSGRSSDHLNDQMEGFTSTEDHVNNMFRALLNIGNAYTKDSPELECIWSLYCQDLDQTAHKQGLYGVAARINSVGLRLIMRQIPPALTFDVILRSLVGWDGLPCRKMFPECSVKNGTMLVAADEGTRVGTNIL